MRPDDDVCLCFHVSQRKLINYLRIERPAKATLLSQCGGAGTGCGWCIPFLQRLFEQHQEGMAADLPEAEEYAAGRQAHIRDGRGSPP